ncbi:ribonuclease E [Buchnera aphidicola (Melanaphis sacchari)]|uniref:Ribonuclease G n=1 Tax=Buchnera aphidicola (Melanaphis sacchari) TaxID=2173854 RepID=A0A2U8DFH3_9GAMM|nr:ribonuclease E [Buchnera aphidicola]AWH90447.1 ribonuclease E [Buchnera aphidicola (Melanaphis sacchari)]
MKRMLINATQQEELRVALVDGQRLYDLDIETSRSEQKKSNIYKGRITHIEPSLEAAFVNYGIEKHGFLPLKEISRNYFPKNYNFDEKINIKKILHEGQEILVQINKEKRGTKGAFLTTFITLAGSYLVLMPYNPKTIGISRRIKKNDRVELRELLISLKVPENMGIIIRTAGVGKSIESLQWDLSLRLKHWDTIQKDLKKKPTPSLIYQESNVIVRAFRDYLKKDIGEILIDNPKILNLAREHIINLGRPDFINKIKLYTGDIPLFSYYQIESQINSAFQRKVRLPSGGSIMVDNTEALTAIDINSSRSTRGLDIEATAFNTNLEAVEEISRQLRLRDLGGLIVIDFIDMASIKHQKIIEKKLRNIVREDRARIQIGSISRFGLLEMSRQRLSSSLGESSHHICPRCTGTGVIRDNESLSLSILRLIEEEALKKNTYEVHAIVPIEIACYLLNEKRDAVHAIEKRQAGGKTIIIPNKNMKTPHYFVSRIKRGERVKATSYYLSNIEKNRSIKNLKKEVFDKKIISRPILTNFNLSNYIFYQKKNNFIKKINYINLFLNIFLNNKNIFKKFIFWIKNKFLIKCLLIKNEILNKNICQNKKKEIYLEKPKKIRKKFSIGFGKNTKLFSNKLHQNYLPKKYDLFNNLENIYLNNFFAIEVKDLKKYFYISDWYKFLFQKINNENLLKILLFYSLFKQEKFLFEKKINEFFLKNKLLLGSFVPSNINIIQNLYDDFFCFPVFIPASVNRFFIYLRRFLATKQLKKLCINKIKNNKKLNTFFQGNNLISPITARLKSSNNKIILLNHFSKEKISIFYKYFLNNDLKKKNIIQKNVKIKLKIISKKNNFLILNKKNIFQKNNFRRKNQTKISSAPITKIYSNKFNNENKFITQSFNFSFKSKTTFKSSAGAHSAINFSTSPITKIK